jgi:hypothetical protein
VEFLPVAVRARSPRLRSLRLNLDVRGTSLCGPALELGLCRRRSPARGADSDREVGGMTGADGSFAIPIRRQGVKRTSLLARSAGGDRLGIFQLTAAQEGVPARITLKPGREFVVRVTDSSKAAVAGDAVEATGNFAVFDDGTTGLDGPSGSTFRRTPRGRKWAGHRQADTDRGDPGPCRRHRRLARRGCRGLRHRFRPRNGQRPGPDSHGWRRVV